MAYYRAYLIGEDGHFIVAISLDCTHDAAAIESAKQFLTAHDVELWQEDRMVTKLFTTNWNLSPLDSVAEKSSIHPPGR